MHPHADSKVNAPPCRLPPLPRVATLLGQIMTTKVYRLTNGSRRKLNAKETIPHDDVTHGAMPRKILKKIIHLATRIELTLLILMPRP